MSLSDRSLLAPSIARLRSASLSSYTMWEHPNNITASNSSSSWTIPGQVFGPNTRDPFLANPFRLQHDLHPSFDATECRWRNSLLDSCSGKDSPSLRRKSASFNQAISASPRALLSAHVSGLAMHSFLSSLQYERMASCSGYTSSLSEGNSVTVWSWLSASLVLYSTPSSFFRRLINLVFLGLSLKGHGSILLCRAGFCRKKSDVPQWGRLRTTAWSRMLRLGVELRKSSCPSRVPTVSHAASPLVTLRQVSIFLHRVQHKAFHKFAARQQKASLAVPEMHMPEFWR